MLIGEIREGQLYSIRELTTAQAELMCANADGAGIRSVKTYPEFEELLKEIKGADGLGLDTRENSTMTICAVCALRRIVGAAYRQGKIRHSTRLEPPRGVGLTLKDLNKGEKTARGRFITPLCNSCTLRTSR